MAATPAPRPLNRKGNPPASQAGTALAVNTKVKGGTANKPKRPASKRGGARNRAERVSECLTLNQAAGVIAAIQASGNIGLPLNRHLTLHWGCYGISDADAGKATGDFLKLAGQFLRSKRQPFAFVYVRENDDGDGSKGPHTHFLLHVPPTIAARFVTMQRRWLRIVTGKAYRRNAMRTARIGRSIIAAIIAPALYEANLAVVAHYVLKAAEPYAVQALGLAHAPEYGRVIGKRAGWSENIGAAARARLAGAASQMTLPLDGL
jgi:hypothetical protein